MTLTRSLLATVLLGGSLVLAQDQSPGTTCPFGHEPGYGRSLSPEARAEHRAAMQQYVAELQAKQAQGTLTAEEAALLEQIGQRGGPCVTGTPRGKGNRQGQGQGAGNGAGQQHRRGLRDGTGPCSGEGTCPNANVPQGQGKGQGRGRR